MTSDDQFEYLPRLIDPLLHECITGLPATAIEGAKGIGKTTSASRLARTILELDDDHIRESLINDQSLIDEGEIPILLDEWQHYPPLWNRIRRLPISIS